MERKKVTKVKSQRTWRELKVTWRCAGAGPAGGDYRGPSRVGDRRTLREGRVILVLLIENPLLIPYCLCFVLGH